MPIDMFTACCNGDKWNGHWKRNKQGECDKAAMKNLTGNNYINAQKVSPKNWASKLQEAANAIKEETDGNKVFIELTDQLGNEFYKLNDTGRYKEYNLNVVTEAGQTFGPFQIEIDQFADPDAGRNDGLEKYWHKTNDNFKFSYTGKSEGLQSILVKDTPEVYWIPNKPILDDCYSYAQVDKVRTEDASDEYSFFSKICYEGGWDNLPGFKVTANVNSFTGKPNAKTAQNQFTLYKNSGYKFPVSIKMEANLICTYNLKIANFNKRHNELTAELTSTQKSITDLENTANLTEEEKDDLDVFKKQEASLVVKIADLDKILERYKSIVNDTSDIERYRQNFISQIATLKVDYDDNSDADIINFVNYGDIANKLECTAGKTDTLYNGEKIVYNKECKLKLTKDMQLPNTCLNMQSGNPENCKNDVAQLAGGNNFFVKLDAKGGKISITVPKAGYSGKLNFEMKNEKKPNNPACYYKKDIPGNNPRSYIIFRQIDVADPFLKNYDRNQGVGRNYSNDTFNFEKIIHDDIWSNKTIADYDYLLSKTNIENIKKDTSEDLKHSYLGRNCYFTSTNKYQCHFTRNENEVSSDNGTLWYSKKSIKEGV